MTGTSYISKDRQHEGNGSDLPYILNANNQHPLHESSFAHMRDENDFQHLYIGSRDKEDRLYTDDQVRHLPCIGSSHEHLKEWQIRKRSAGRLLNYLAKKNKQLTILEVGCGNGWLSGKMAELPHSTVTGIDVNLIELNQAKRCFQYANLHFVEGGLSNIQLSSTNSHYNLTNTAVSEKFDVIVFAASIQYFSSLHQIIQDAFSVLNGGGEIHILDSHFYEARSVADARHRSNGYYRSIGFEKMSAFYFHHATESLSGFPHKLLFNPHSFVNKVFGPNDPFPWICVQSP